MFVVFCTFFIVHDVFCNCDYQQTPRPCKLTFDLLTLKVVSESRVRWATSVPIFVFLDLSVFDLGPMYATDKTDVRRASSLNAPTLGAGHNKRTRMHVRGSLLAVATLRGQET